MIDLTFQTETKQISIFGCYRPRSLGSEFLDALSESVLARRSKVDDVLVVGDLNYDLHSSSLNELHDVCECIALHNTVSSGTRLNHASRIFTLLDVILS